VRRRIYLSFEIIIDRDILQSWWDVILVARFDAADPRSWKECPTVRPVARNQRLTVGYLAKTEINCVSANNIQYYSHFPKYRDYRHRLRQVQ